ncbi:MAG: GLPGLI family protein [Bacteroidota bacterium]|nr:GLPGLI family protein [Bacteroidota bacterium]
MCFSARPLAGALCRWLIAVLPALAAWAPANAQNAVFLSEGRIEFERKVNLYAQMDHNDSWSDLQKKTMPQFKTTWFDLYFNSDKTLFKPGRENPDNNKLWEQPAEENVVFSDLGGEKMTSQKKIFESLFLVQDSTRRINWKITDENRTIAGFACRRANAIIMDSIYVVAFYTDEILTSGGPESFSGLPGMILGVALPHQHITWFATKVQAVRVNPTDLTAPVKGKKVDPHALRQTLKESMKDFDKNFLQRNMEAALL